MHTFASFLVERAFEQVKLGFGHQDVGGVLVGAGGSFDVAAGGRTHQSPGDVALLDTLPAGPSTRPAPRLRSTPLLRASVGGDGLHYVRVVGPDERVVVPVRAGSLPRRTPRGRRHRHRASGRCSTPSSTPPRTGTSRCSTRARSGRSTPPGCGPSLGTPEVVLVEPWLAGTSAHEVAAALRDVPHRLLALGVGRTELRRYGTPEDHVAAHGLDAAGIRASLDGFLVRAA